MEIINITEEQKNKLCTELARLLFEFRKNENIECIYYKTFIGLLGYGKNVLDIVLVSQGNIEEEDKECVRGYEHYTNEDALKEYGVKIHICMDHASLYTTMALKEEEIISQIDLFNSTILFDRTGKYTEIQKAGVNENVYFNEDTYRYRDLAEIFPPINETLANAIDVARMERDTKAFKEFTKSKLFEDIMNM